MADLFADVSLPDGCPSLPTSSNLASMTGGVSSTDRTSESILSNMLIVETVPEEEESKGEYEDTRPGTMFSEFSDNQKPPTKTVKKEHGNPNCVPAFLVTAEARVVIRGAMMTRKNGMKQFCVEKIVPGSTCCGFVTHKNKSKVELRHPAYYVVSN